MTDRQPDDAWLTDLQRAAFGYFTDAVNPTTGLVTDTSRPGSPISIAVVGFALSVYPVAVERGWLTLDPAWVARAEALAEDAPAEVLALVAHARSSSIFTIFLSVLPRI